MTKLNDFLAAGISHARDIVILAAIFIAACAIGFALYQEAGLSALAAFCTSLTLLFTMSTVHVILLRIRGDEDMHHHIDALYNDIDYLRREVSAQDSALKQEVEKRPVLHGRPAELAPAGSSLETRQTQEPKPKPTLTWGDASQHPRDGRPFEAKVLEDLRDILFAQQQQIRQEEREAIKAEQVAQTNLGHGAASSSPSHRDSQLRSSENQVTTKPSVAPHLQVPNQAKELKDYIANREHQRLAATQEPLRQKKETRQELEHYVNNREHQRYDAQKTPEKNRGFSSYDEQELEKAEALLNQIRGVGGGSEQTLAPHVEALDRSGEIALHDHLQVLKTSPILAENADASALLTQVENMIEKTPNSMSFKRTQTMPNSSNAPQGTQVSPEETIVDMVADALENDRLDIYLQPVVALPSRHIRYYEVLTRLRDRDGQTHEPVSFMPMAEYAGLLPLLDNMVVLKAVELAKAFGERGKPRSLFCNISGQSLLDDDFFGDFLNFMGRNKWLQGQIYFEVAQDALMRFSGPLEERLTTLAEHGFGLSLDHVVDLSCDFHKLRKWNVKFLKLETKLFLNGVERAGAPFPNEDMKSFLERFGISLILEKVENEAEAIQIGAHQIPFGQGNLFCEPKPVRANILKPKLANTATNAG